MFYYYLALGFSLFWLFLSVSIIYILLRSIINGAVYFPTSRANLDIMMKLADIKPGEKVADLGSGDGRILIAMAEAGAAEAHGYEINPILVWRSRRTIKRAGLEKKVFVHWRSFWRDDFSSFDVVTVYGIPYIMKNLESKLKKELKPESRVVSNIFSFPSWPQKISESNVHLYPKN